MTGLEDVEPLFTPDMFVYYDRYIDGDDYSGAGYIARFHTILRALRDGEDLFVSFETGRGKRVEIVVTPNTLNIPKRMIDLDWWHQATKGNGSSALPA